jgi:hypothetical protein
VTESDTPVVEAPRRFQNLTFAGTIVAIFAILTVVSIPYLSDYEASYGSGAPPPVTFAVPQLLIIAAISAGFRRFGDILALLVGIPLLLAFGLNAVLAFLGGDPRSVQIEWQLFFSQLMMALAAGTDLASSRRFAAPVAPLNRLLGLTVPTGVAVIMSLLTHTRVAADTENARAQEESQQVDAQIKAAAWLNDSKIDDVVRLAGCVEQFRGDSITGRAPKSLQELYQWSLKKNNETSDCGLRMFEAGYRARYGLTGKEGPLDTLPHPDWGDKHHVVYYRPPKHLRGDPLQRAAFTLGIEAVWDSTEFPNALGRPGTRNYFLDADREIHVSAERRRANITDPVVPVCNPHERERSDGRECHESFESRQR